jgi:hypothetical protein
MGLNEKTLIRQYEREKDIHRNISKIPDEGKNNGLPITFSSVVITPRMIIVSGIILLAVASFAYLYREVNSFVSTPRLVIIKPADSEDVDGNSVHIVGAAEKDALVFINDQPVLVSEKGEFSEDVSLKEGLNMITVKARSRFNKEAVKSVSVNARFQNTAEDALADQQNPDQQPQQPTDPGASVDNKNPISVDVYVSPNPTWLSIEADGNLVYSGVLLPQSVQTFSAKGSVSITSGKGNGTFVKVNGKDMGAISSDPGVVREVKYDASGKVDKSR